MASAQGLFERHRSAWSGCRHRQVLSAGTRRSESARIGSPTSSRQALRNILAILACDGADASRIVRLTCYVTSIDEYLESAKEIGASWREIMGKHYPAMALVEVVRLVERDAKVEIEATAVVPE